MSRFNYSHSLARSSEGLHVCAIQVLAGIHTQLRAEILVVGHAVRCRGRRRSRPALDAAVDDVDRDAEPRGPASGGVGAAGSPVADHHVMAGGLRARGCSPEPKGGFEGERGVGGDEVRVAQDVFAHRPARGPVVVIPAYKRSNLVSV
jgi:hypothetical protein